ncbi:hypothetical protein AALP_AA3G244000 [Arabis alpina]|uniref:Uncharacterized protein n=1 Tax=Arabis alpina TaxID=50452 RepID=A0A087HBC9_ARAAL|nr:hypothetical protein AALP_AA3G244000 [Arabis alpina]
MCAPIDLIPDRYLLAGFRDLYCCRSPPVRVGLLVVKLVCSAYVVVF